MLSDLQQLCEPVDRICGCGRLLHSHNAGKRAEHRVSGAGMCVGWADYAHQTWRSMAESIFTVVVVVADTTMEVTDVHGRPLINKHTDTRCTGVE